MDKTKELDLNDRLKFFNKELIMPKVLKMERFGTLYIEKELAKHGITQAEFRIVGIVLGSKEGVIQKDIAKRLNIRAATLSATVKNLEEKKIIRRIVDPDDHRIKRITIAENLDLDEITKIVRTLEEKATKGIPQEEVEIAKQVLARMASNMSSDVE